MSRLPPLPTIQEIIRIYGLSARKQLSQNFLLDMNLTDKIVRAAGKLDSRVVIEVGPGPGGITRSILNTSASRLIVIEKDKRFLPSLQILKETSNHRMEVIHGDVLDFNLQSLLSMDYKTEWKDRLPNIHIIGNLPFSVSTPLIIQWLRSMSKMSGAWSYGRTPCTLTFQKEVAERIIAPPKSEYRCRLSVMCQYLCDTKLKFTIPGKAFVPPPEVDVGVVKFVPLKEPLIHQPFALVEKVCRHLFNTPNKYFIRGVRSLFPVERDDLSSQIMEMCGLNPQMRAFELSVQEIGQICDAYAKIVEKEPEILTYDVRDNRKVPRWKNTEIVTSDIEAKILNGSLEAEETESEQYANFNNSK
uniref:rRNA adenine N(6)-methyltransferase n=1 Tax=Arion vulgaris TaxID=1028688 RepID=A0A0B7BIC6_9EUPU